MEIADPSQKPRKGRCYPAVTHLLFAGSYPFLTTGARQGDPCVRVSFSSSLPRITRNEFKKLSREHRLQSLTRQVGEGVVDFMQVVLSANAGNCAETLNFASLYVQGKPMIVLAFGEALAVNSFSGTFSIKKLIESSHKPACDACRVLFSLGGVTEQDIASGQIIGLFPRSVQLQRGWDNNMDLCFRCGVDLESPQTPSGPQEPQPFTVFCDNCTLMGTNEDLLRNIPANAIELDVNWAPPYPSSDVVFGESTQHEEGGIVNVPGVAGYYPFLGSEGYQRPTENQELYAAPHIVRPYGRGRGRGM